ncbi:hypothetical protein LCGC14_1955670 [marine sediment metagenome]|uniref:Uncharacterized protein n=1 Tax=marine sediment metagenome TaxID=412755 RepID=A0A0F9FG42_9ZZZZ
MKLEKYKKEKKDEEKMEKELVKLAGKEFDEKIIDDGSEEDIQLYKYEMIHGENYNEQNKEELLMDRYEKETGKNPITARKTVRKDYIKWKET